jgi:hypothetical protein
VKFINTKISKNNRFEMRKIDFGFFKFKAADVLKEFVDDNKKS